MKELIAKIQDAYAAFEADANAQVEKGNTDRTYKLTNELLPPAHHSVFIKDQENGDLKRLKSYAADGKSNPQFYLSSFADAYYCEGDTITKYESWYA